MNKPIRTLIVDDSKIVRMVLNEILSQSPDIEVCGMAVDPYDAREKMKVLNPDVVTLDIEMPKMDGISFLKKIMRLRPTRVVMVSTLTKKGAAITLEALEIGAVDFVHKPGQSERDIKQLADELISKIITAAQANLHAIEQLPLTQKTKAKVKPSSYELISIGASTGGTEAIKEALLDYPKNGPPVVISQHIPPIFSTTYAQRLSATLNIPVIEVTEKVKLEAGSIYLAHGDHHMIFKNLQGLIAIPDSSEKVNKHRPSVDVMFHSLSDLKLKSVLAILLTGMGADGASGLLRLKNQGVKTIAQDKESSIVWGMPKKAIELGAATEILSLQKIRDTLAKVAMAK